METTIKLRSRWSGESLLLKVMIQHPMETGRRIDGALGTPIEAHFIEELQVLLNGEPSIEATLTQAVSKNPYFAFELKGVKPDDVLTVRWRDNRGGQDQSSLKVTDG